jgi:hypothetical protein
MNEPSWATLVRLVHERADYCCEYCQTCQQIIGQAMHVDHIDPHGSDDLENLCLSCPNCNQSKARAVSAFDPDTQAITVLFNPRTQKWADHFAWIDGGQRLKGLTATARATIERLKINQDRVVVSRTLWIRAGNHPPRR